MTVSDMAHLALDEFTVVVKEPGECFKYQCSSKNQTNREDFMCRHIHEIRVVSNQMYVYCW